MRRARVSLSATEGLETLLAQGMPKFGLRTILDKKRLIYEAIETRLARQPRIGAWPIDEPFHHYEVRDTPFVVIYEFDDDELRVLFIVHKSQDRRSLNPADVDW